MTDAQRRNVERDRMQARSIARKLERAKREATDLAAVLVMDGADDAAEVWGMLVDGILPAIRNAMLVAWATIDRIEHE